MKRYISIDIGGTAIKYGIIGEDAKIMLKKSMPTEAGKGGPAILDKVIGIILASSPIIPYLIAVPPISILIYLFIL